MQLAGIRVHAWSCYSQATCGARQHRALPALRL
jgi:hypothetical protein